MARKMGSAPDLSGNVNRGLAWIGLASSLVGILDFLALLIISAFWIGPEEYGTATIAIAAFPVLDQLTDLGLSSAVIQRDRRDPDIISSVFWINLAVAGVLFLMLLAVAPGIGSTFENATIGTMLIVYGSKLLWQNVYFIPVALMKRDLRFKELSVIRIIANLTEFAGKVGFAAAGFGVWAFILGPLGRVFVTGIGAQICNPWRPRFVLKLRETWDYVTFGLKASASQILFSLYTNADYWVIGYFYSETAVGIYRLAFEIVLEPVKMISNVVVDIAFPTFARLRHHRDKLIAQFISFTRLNLVTVMIYSAVVFVLAEEIVTVFFPKYDLFPVDSVRILTGVAILRSLSYVLPPLLDGVGHPSRTLIYMIVASIVLPAFFIGSVYLLGDPHGFEAVAVAWAVGYPIAFAVLLLLATYTIKLPVRTFLRQTAGVPLCILTGGLLGGATKWALMGAPTAVRGLAVLVVIVGVSGLLLAYTQGLSPARARAALRGKPALPDPSVVPPSAVAPVEVTPQPTDVTGDEPPPVA